MKQRVVKGHEVLARLSAESAPRDRGVTPSLFTRRQAARALGYLFLGGSAVVLVTLLLPHDEMVKDGPLFALTAATAAIGAGILCARTRPGAASCTRRWPRAA